MNEPNEPIPYDPEWWAEQARLARLLPPDVVESMCPPLGQDDDDDRPGVTLGGQEWLEQKVREARRKK